MSNVSASITPDAAEEQLRKSINDGNLEVIKITLDEHPELLHRPQREGNWLDVAAMKPNSEIVSFFASKGLPLDATNFKALPTLWRAIIAEEGCDVIRTLLNLGADPDRLHNGRYPLHAAAISTRHWKPLIEMLAEHGADLNVINSDKQTPLSLAARWGQPEAVMLLLHLGADPFLHVRDARNAMKQAAMATQRSDLAEIIKGFAGAKKAQELILDVAQGVDATAPVPRPL